MNDYFAEYKYIVGEYVKLRRSNDLNVYEITYIDAVNGYVNLRNITYEVGSRSEKRTSIYPLSKQKTADFLIDKMFKLITT